MRQIILSASEWQTANDFYDAFLAAVGTPSWHGHNLDALWDSIVTGSINQIEPPYPVVITGVGRTSADGRKIIERFLALMKEAREQGTPVEVSLKR